MKYVFDNYLNRSVPGNGVQEFHLPHQCPCPSQHLPEQSGSGQQAGHPPAVEHSEGPDVVLLHRLGEPHHHPPTGVCLQVVLQVCAYRWFLYRCMLTSWSCTGVHLQVVILGWGAVQSS